MRQTDTRKISKKTNAYLYETIFETETDKKLSFGIYCATIKTSYGHRARAKNKEEEKSMKFLRKMYQKSKEQKGFTLVEMIVVLVIIAILAAITIPALLKYIDKARDKQVVINARTAYLAAETAASEAYAASYTATNFTFTNSSAAGSTDISKVQANAADLTGLSSNYSCEVTVKTDWKITNVVFKDKKADKTATLNVASGSAWTVTKGSN